MTHLFQRLWRVRMARHIQTAAVLALLGVITACAHRKANENAFPGPYIWHVESAGAPVSSVRPRVSAGRLYVSGHIRKNFGRHVHHAAHVDVGLIDGDGRLIAEKRDDIDAANPNTAGGRSKRMAFVVSFPISEARHAAKVIVQYHEDSHSS